MRTAQLVGFCDASAKAYAAVVYMYLRLEGCDSVSVKFLVARTSIVSCPAFTSRGKNTWFQPFTHA